MLYGGHKGIMIKETWIMIKQKDKLGIMIKETWIMIKQKDKLRIMIKQIQ